MKNPKLKVKLKHSQTKSAWNIIGTIPGDKYKIARIPYSVYDNEIISNNNREEAYNIAEYIETCLNQSDFIEKCLSNKYYSKIQDLIK